MIIPLKELNKDTQKKEGKDILIKVAKECNK